ncbi:flavoprotein, partial [Stenotrophomonas maltophilia]|uniref:flavoprotein n=1 Tax=Stenotrophomonas maltophilia TaxID=40324 RepID=UPI001954B6A9
IYMPKKIIIAITGASGSIYASSLLHKLAQHQDQFTELGIVMSKNAKDVWQTELGNNAYQQLPFRFYEKQD